MLRKRALLLMLIASAILAGAIGVQAEGQALGPGERLLLSLGGDIQFVSFVAEANSDYSVQLLPAGEGDFLASMALYREDELLAKGEKSLSARLTAGTEYALALSGEGEAWLEVSRDKLSRCFAKPIDLRENDGYSKLIAMPGDVHWYRFTSETAGLAVVAALPVDPEVRMECMLLDRDGRTLDAAGPSVTGEAAVCAELRAGEQYYIRVSGAGDAVGEYRMTVVRDGAAGVPAGVSLSIHEIQLSKGDVVELLAEIEPEGAFSAVYFSSSDDRVAGVTRTGVVSARSAGSAVIVVTGYGGVRDVCLVTVERVPLDGIAFEEGRTTLRVGQEAALGVAFYPEDATERGVSFVCEDETIASVTAGGVVTGLRRGRTTVTATAADGGFEDVVEIEVLPAAPGLYALLVGEQNYREDVNGPRMGSINSVESVARMLGELSLQGGRFRTSTLYDTSAQGVCAAIRNAFSAAAEGDRCLFYITCHGYYRHGMSFFQMADGSVMSARDLERELRRLPCQVTVIVDCCGSGGVLGEATAMEDFNSGVISAFAGNVGSGVFASSKYRVLASAALDQDSYRVSFDGAASEERMATIFARALCDAAGWSMDREQRSALRADMDYDRRLTLNELWLYTSKRVMWYLDLATRGAPDRQYTQYVQVFPENDATVLFER